MCCAHIGRELQGLVDTDGEVWAENMRDHLNEALAAARAARKTGVWLTEQQITSLEQHYDLLVGDGIAHHEALPPLRAARKGRPKRRPGHNLAIRLRDFRDATLRFLRNPAVPPTNNTAEQDIRCCKIKQKISGSFRTADGAEAFAILRSLVETGRKQNWNPLSVFTADPEMLIKGLRTADGPAPEP